MEKTANFYNEKNGVSKGEIVVFGKMTDIYTYDIIVLDKVLREAKRYGDKYYVAYEKLESIAMLGMVESMGYGTLSCCPNLFKISAPTGSKILNLKTVLKAGLGDRKDLHSRRESCTVNGRRVITMYLTK